MLVHYHNEKTKSKFNLARFHNWNNCWGILYQNEWMDERMNSQRMEELNFSLHRDKNKCVECSCFTKHLEFLCLLRQSFYICMINTYNHFHMLRTYDGIFVCRELNLETLTRTACQEKNATWQFQTRPQSWTSWFLLISSLPQICLHQIPACPWYPQRCRAWPVQPARGGESLWETLHSCQPISVAIVFCTLWSF